MIKWLDKLVEKPHIPANGASKALGALLSQHLIEQNRIVSEPLRSGTHGTV